MITIPQISALQSERIVAMSSVNTSQKSPENPFKIPVGESNAEKETPVKETPTGETETREEDNVEDLFVQMRLTESKENHDALSGCLFRDSVEKRLQQGKALEEEELEEEKCDKREQRSQEQVQQTDPPSGFDFQHLKVLRDIPLSSFYGVDIDNLSLPLQPSSNDGSFYGVDKESLAAENAALDEFYAKIKGEKTACEKDQSSGNMCSQDQSRNFVCPGSASEVDDDFSTLRILLSYKLNYGSLPNIFDQPATTFGLHIHHLLGFVNEELGSCISGSRLTDKLIKLQTNYKKLVAEKGKTPEEQDFSTPRDYGLFEWSQMAFERDQV
ncbi:hypothetical protein POM88_015054 [Heracleum sosnowskyi]|uniref:Uncharacterized protein n=1 Tax=Heracleum sosnowskyi TaxID=360622 RepID=A0AAD8IL28_9APIA|nr:hypothetical protein POM88_015054 [Heracleum sosnowskyi]